MNFRMELSLRQVSTILTVHVFKLYELTNDLMLAKDADWVKDYLVTSLCVAATMAR